jgi:hypothetical protein
MKNKALVTILIHTGKKEYHPLLENLLKSFLICNQYPNIELLFVESAGDEEIRDWLNLLDFDSKFINFDGTKTNVIKQDDVEIKKSVLFTDFVEDKSVKDWDVINQAVLKSIDLGIKKSRGKYVACLLEDNQFILKGDMISDYLKVLKHFGEDNTIVHFFAQQNYKYFKPNNAFKEPIEIDDGITVYKPIEMKFCPWSLFNKSMYNRAGEITIKKSDKAHEPISKYSEKCKELGMNRVYMAIPMGIWFYNKHREQLIENIKEKTKANPDYCMFKFYQKSDLDYNIVKKLSRPLSVDDFLMQVNE